MNKRVTFCSLTIILFAAFFSQIWTKLYPVTYPFPTQAQLDFCQENKQINWINAAKTNERTISASWCQITAAKNKIIPVLVDGSEHQPNAYIQIKYLKPKLTIHPLFLSDSNQSLLFVLAHEYHHYLYGHSWARSLRTVLLSISFIFLIGWLYPTKNTPFTQSLMDILPYTFMWLTFFYYSYASFIQEEVDADLGAAAYFKSIGLSPIDGINEVLKTTKNFGDPNNLPTMIACLSPKYLLNMNNCNPHPTMEYRAKQVAKKY